LRGGPAIVTALACAFFTAFTGASGVTILALGGLLMPILLTAKYSERSALGLLTGAGSLGVLLPPCLPLILYAIIAKVEIEQIFLGGIVPGLLLIIITACWGALQVPAAAVAGRKFVVREAGRAGLGTARANSGVGLDPGPWPGSHGVWKKRRPVRIHGQARLPPEGAADGDAHPRVQHEVPGRLLSRDPVCTAGRSVAQLRQ
jgi:hypothetical protein